MEEGSAGAGGTQRFAFAHVFGQRGLPVRPRCAQVGQSRSAGATDACVRRQSRELVERSPASAAACSSNKRRPQPPNSVSPTEEQGRRSCCRRNRQCGLRCGPGTSMTLNEMPSAFTQGAAGDRYERLGDALAHRAVHPGAGGFAQCAHAADVIGDGASPEWPRAPGRAASARQRRVPHRRGRPPAHGCRHAEARGSCR